MPAKVASLPLTVIGESVKVSETAFVAPSHKGIVPPVPAPDITDELSILCHKSVPAPGVTSENIHQSPTAQESGSTPDPFGAAIPAVLTI